MTTTYKLVLSLSLVALLAAGCNSANAPAPSSTNPLPQQNSTANTSNTSGVTIAGMAFSPATITVKKGTSVTWTNNDSVSHTVTGNNGGPNSSTLGNGQSYSFTFNTTGTFKYICAIHPSMTGTVIVTE